jgi:peptidoglycan/xylan/chitin deacetylase (PgdA/CDA1 family)
MIAPSATAEEPMAESRGRVCITFDDGAKSVYEEAFPVMSAASITATAFAVTDWIGGVGGVVTSFECMDDTELLTLQAAGWEVGSHSVSHAYFNESTPEQAKHEMSESKAVLEALGIDVDTFCYPYGQYTTESIAIGSEFYKRQRSTDGILQYLSDYPYSRPVTGSYEPDTWAQTQSYIDKAIRTDTTVVLLYHQLDVNGRILGTDYNVRTLVDYIAEMRDRHGLQAINYRDLPNAQPNADIFVWDGEGATVFANETANWRRVSASGVVTNDVLPTPGSHLVWNATSNTECVYNIDVAAYSWSINNGYTKTVKQVFGYDIDIGEGGFVNTRKTTNAQLNGHTEQTITCAGDWSSYGYVLADTINLEMTGDGAMLLSQSNIYNTITVSGSVYYQYNAMVTNYLEVSDGASLILEPGSVLTVRTMTVSDCVRVSGIMSGDGQLVLSCRSTDGAFDLSNISVGSTIVTQSPIAAAPRSATLSGYTETALSIANDHATIPYTVHLGERLSVTSLTTAPRTVLRGGNGAVTTSSWNSTAGMWLPEQSTVILRDGGSAVLAPGQSFNNLGLLSKDGRSGCWTINGTSAMTILTGLDAGKGYLWYLDGVEQGEVTADVNGTIALSYQSVGLHELSVGPTPMTIAMDGVYTAFSIMIACAVIGGMVAMVGRIKI